MKDKLLEGSMLVKGSIGQEEFHIVEDHEEKDILEVSDFCTDEEGLIRMSFYVGKVGVCFQLEKTKQIRDYLNKIIAKQEVPE